MENPKTARSWSTWPGCVSGWQNCSCVAIQPPRWQSHHHEAQHCTGADCLQVRRESHQHGVAGRAWAILFAYPPLHRASLGTGRCEACRKVPTPGRRIWTPGERKRAMGNTVNTYKPREVEGAKAAERPSPKWYVGRMGRSGVCPSTGQRPTGGEGDPKACDAPAGGTR